MQEPAMTLAIVFALSSLAATPIQLTPDDVDSDDSGTFSTLPSDDPSLFGFTGTTVSINFDVDAAGNDISAGAVLTDEYRSLGVEMDDIEVASAVWGGAASGPNTTYSYGNTRQVFNFLTPATVVGFINTSPDFDSVAFYDGLDGTGTELLSFRDQQDVLDAGDPADPDTDRFLGGRAEGSERFASMVVHNAAQGNLELDELVIQTGGISAHATAPVRGDLFEFSISGATPGAVVYLGSSFDGTGTGPCQGALCLGIVGQILSHGAVTADSFGIATWALDVPTTAPLGPVWFQSVQNDGGQWSVSNVVGEDIADL